VVEALKSLDGEGGVLLNLVMVWLTVSGCPNVGSEELLRVRFGSEVLLYKGLPAL
jgi:hypothetical protein